MELTDIISRVRIDIGDVPQNFNTSTISDGQATWFDLPQQLINSAGLVVEQINGPYVTILTTPLNYTLDAEHGQLSLTAPLPYQETLRVSGSCWALFTDTELSNYIWDAVAQHFYNRTMTERFKDIHGFFTYRDTPITLSNCPRIEEPLVVQLAEINALWSMAIDASTDVDIQTAEGTNIERSQRYSQLMGMIDELTRHYAEWCGQMNVGLFRSETLEMRRVSQTTGRLVPLFKNREFDDHRFPVRKLPEIVSRNLDNSGYNSPIWNGMGQ